MATPFRSPDLFLGATVPVPVRIPNLMMLRSLRTKGFHILSNLHNKEMLKIEWKKIYKIRCNTPFINCANCWECVASNRLWKSLKVVRPWYNKSLRSGNQASQKAHFTNAFWNV